jgi:hypothetical protein
MASDEVKVPGNRLLPKSLRAFREKLYLAIIKLPEDTYRALALELAILSIGVTLLLYGLDKLHTWFPVIPEQPPLSSNKETTPSNKAASGNATSQSIPPELQRLQDSITQAEVVSRPNPLIDERVSTLYADAVRRGVSDSQIFGSAHRIIERLDASNKQLNAIKAES